MLNIFYFIASVSSIIWISYTSQFINIKSTQSPSELETAIIICFLPIAILWIIFNLIKNYHFEQKQTNYVFRIVEQVNANAKKTSSLEQSLLAVEQEIKNSFILEQFNFLISDINEILSDILKRSNSISSAQLEHLWERAAGGERWIIAKTFIEITDFQTNFSENLKNKALKDTLLKGNILEFYSRYNSLLKILKSNNTQEIFCNIIEYGALGKVHNILSDIANSLLNNQSYYEEEKNPIKIETKTIDETNITISPNVSQDTLTFPSFLSNSDSSPHFTISHTDESNNKSETPTNKKAPEEIEFGLKAIRDELYENSHKEEENISTPIISSFTKTQMALRDINRTSEPTFTRKETPIKNNHIISLDEIEKEINASPENNYDENAYPFGAWLDEKKNS